MKLKVIILAIILVVFGIGTYFYVRTNILRNSTSAVLRQGGEIILSPQASKEVIMVDSVTMDRNGWVVARAIEGNRLSQIIEISRYLEKGEYKDVQITLGEFYSGEESLVMIYTHDGDKIFNDNDQPSLDQDGKMSARYVATGEVVPTSMMQPDPNAMAGHMMGGSMMTVRYTDNGFIPATLEVPVGTMVQFINESNDVMWVASNEHPGHEILPTFDQFGTAEKGGSYMYTFDKSGNWAYHDHINAAKEGVIAVQ